MERAVRVLHVVGAMYPGGLENFIMNLYEHVDLSRVHFDFAVHQRREGDYGERIGELGGQIHELPRLTRHPVENLRELEKITREGEYDVVIRHTANALVTPQLLAARRGGAATVLHAHSSTDPMKALHYAGRMLSGVSADVRLACSEEAGRWMYGRRDFRVVPNAIDIAAFAYKPEGERRIRAEFGLEGAHVYGSIANFVPPKNHPFMLEVFRKIADADPAARLLLVGEGDLREQVEEKIRALSLEDKVILAGLRKDVPACMAAVDVLLFPSVFEGLPLSLIEAQAAGLPALVSDAVTEKVVVTDGLIRFLPLSEGAERWAEEAGKLCAARGDKETARIPQREKIAAAGYDVEALASWFADFAEELAEKNRNRKGAENGGGRA